MSRDIILKDHEGTRYSFDNIKTQGYLDGHSPRVAAAVNWLRNKSVDLFRVKKDQEAIMIRDLADELLAKVDPGVREHAKRHSREYPIILDDETPDFKHLIDE